MKSRRAVLDTIRLHNLKGPHPGLWLDKFLPEQESQGGEGTFGKHFREAATIPVSSVYRTFFDAWKQALKQEGVITKEAKALGRLAIGLGAESVLETNITIHRTYGVPYIPGSALKGLAARYARLRLGDEWKVDGETYQTLFGDTSIAGYVTFLDALYVPGSVKGDRPLLIDVITVHHPEYYRGDKDAAPADWDSPTPVPFLSAIGSYLIALHGPNKWVDAAFQILALALREEGIGAKTSSGYGRMAVDDVDVRATFGEAKTGQTTSQHKPEEPTVQLFRMRLDAMSNKDVAGQIHSVYQEWKALEAGAEVKHQIAQMILDKIKAAGRTRKSKSREWYQALVDYTRTT